MTEFLDSSLVKTQGGVSGSRKRRPSDISSHHVVQIRSLHTSTERIHPETTIDGDTVQWFAPLDAEGRSFVRVLNWPLSSEERLDAFSSSLGLKDTGKDHSIETFVIVPTRYRGISSAGSSKEYLLPYIRKTSGFEIALLYVLGYSSLVSR